MIVYDIADFYADAYVPVRYSFLRKIVRLFEVFLIKTVTATILVDEARIKQIGFKPARFCIIYNSPPDIYEKFSLAKNSAEKKGRLDIFYAGGISESQGVYTLVDGCQEVSGLSLKVAGFGKDIEHFSNYIKNKKGVEFLGRISYWKVLELTMQSDCVAVLYDPRIPNMIYSSPNKLFEAMMCGKAIIVSAGTAMAKKVLNENCGLVVTCGSVAGLQEALSQLKDDPSLSMELGQNGRKAYLKKYNWCLMEKRLVLLYTSLILEKEN
jgi:glycosyltransferase involved in cell wall biosynthesis